LQLSNWILKG